MNPRTKAVDKQPAERSVIVNNSVFLYNEKAPFTPSGVSVLGALEYDPEDSTVRCHECGLWFKGLSTHINAVHKVTAPEYKRRHGLKATSALIGETTREKFIAAIKTNDAACFIKKGQTLAKGYRGKRRDRGLKVVENQNHRMLCAAQLEKKLRDLATTLGRTPTQRERVEYGIRNSALLHAFGSWKRAAKICSLSYRPERGQKYSDDQLLDMIRTVAISRGRLPTPSDCRRGLLAGRTTYVERFGSWPNAVRKAGFEPPQRGGSSFKPAIPISGLYPARENAIAL